MTPQILSRLRALNSELSDLSEAANKLGLRDLGSTLSDHAYEVLQLERDLIRHEARVLEHTTDQNLLPLLRGEFPKS